MLDDLSRPARLPSEALTLPAMESAKEKPRGGGTLSAVRRNWPNVQPEQRAIPLGWENAGGSPEMGSAVDPMTMGRAALHSLRNGAYHT
ncbi:MAG: hypothetical protein FWD25_04110 [Clostridia bacterium]|nr:hypothetical protein [Clostridia bacterium]